MLWDARTFWFRVHGFLVVIRSFDRASLSISTVCAELVKGVSWDLGFAGLHPSP